MRKRNAARPVLESMEERQVPSFASLLNPAAALQSAIAAITPAHHADAATAHHSKSEVVKQHQHTTKAAHAVHAAHHQPAKSSSGGSLSNFFKSVFPGI
jgi:hypothetical protein